MRILRNLFDRLLPALLMASSVTLLGAGLLSYAPSAIGDLQTADPGVAVGDPRLTPPPTSKPSNAPPATTTPVPLDPTATDRPPSASASPGPEPGQGVASRIRIPSLRIDLPVVPGDLIVPGNVDLYPLCDVAMFLPEYVQPAVHGATYIYAHARDGMFRPLLLASEQNNGRRMLGMTVEVYTSDDWLFLYTISEVRRHTRDLNDAVNTTTERLWMQTSTGPNGTVPKLQVVADFLSAEKTKPKEAHPEAHPRICT